MAIRKRTNNNLEGTYEKSRRLDGCYSSDRPANGEANVSIRANARKKFANCSHGILLNLGEVIYIYRVSLAS